MSFIKAPPKEGDLYKVIKIDDHTFELRFGFYADYERETGEPVVIYPDLIKNKTYTKNGEPIVTAIQDPCKYYDVSVNNERNECCGDCRYFVNPEDEIGICTHSGKCTARGDSNE